MRYKGYVVSYTGESKKVNTDNFFLNGICKESVDEPFLIEDNKEFTSRNIYALSSGGKSVAIGDELAYIAVDILRNFQVADFESVNREYFHVANTAITSQVLDRNDEHYEVDLSVLSIDRDVATVYNMGDIPVFYFDGRAMKNLAGQAPTRVSLAKDYLDKFGEVQSEIFDVKNVSRIGELSSDMEVVPYTSKKMKLNKSCLFVMCSSDVMKVLDEKVIENVLRDERIKTKNKALAILDKAVKANSDGCYTVEVIAVGHGLAIAEKELMSLGRWFVVACVCLVLCANSSFVLSYVSDFIGGCKAFVQKYFGEDEIDEDFEFMIESDTETAEDTLNAGEETTVDESGTESAETENADSSEAQNDEGQNTDALNSEAQVVEQQEGGNSAPSENVNTGASTSAKTPTRTQNTTSTPKKTTSSESVEEEKTAQTTPVANEDERTEIQSEAQATVSNEPKKNEDAAATTEPEVQNSGANELPIDLN